jgi:hypothetical protein
VIGRRAFALLATLALVTGATVSAQTSWTLGVAPLFAVGGSDAGPDRELNLVSGAMRLPDGRVVVANGKPLELRVYSAKGALLTRMGRKGQGPGEFRGGLDLIAASGDSVVVFTGGSRWEVFRIDGKLIREWTTPYADRPQTTFYRRAFTRPPSNGISACARRLLDALPVPPATALHEVFADERGRNWVRTYGDTNHWTIYSRAQRILGTVNLPPGFELYQAGTDFVLGRSRDENDFELVVAYHLSIPAPVRTEPSRACAEAGVSPSFGAESARVSAFRVVLRSSMTAMEAAYAQSHQYPRTPDALHLDVPSKARVELLHVDDHGYVVGVFDLTTNLFCAVGVGAGTPLGWGDGELHCGN